MNPPTELPPERVCGYDVLRVLAPGRTYLVQSARPSEAEAEAAAAAPSRRIVLKLLDRDCMVPPRHEELHPAVRDRLGRVRELAEPHVANFIGVEREPAPAAISLAHAGSGAITGASAAPSRNPARQSSSSTNASSGGSRGGPSSAAAPAAHRRAFLMWEYVAGESLVNWIARAKSPGTVTLIVRELLVQVESLHWRGLVHGALHGGNILVDPAGRVILTDVSPLLFHDPNHDVTTLLDTLAKALAGAPGGRAELADLVAAARAKDEPIRWLRGAISSSPAMIMRTPIGMASAERSANPSAQSPEFSTRAGVAIGAKPQSGDGPDRDVGRRSLKSAAIVTVAGLLFAGAILLGVKLFTGGAGDQRAPLPSSSAGQLRSPAVK